jgi:signal transduction histidine kinase
MKPRIMFVDDEEKVLQGLKRMLHGSNEEWDLEFVSDVATAEEILLRGQVDLMVLDVRMPHKDGIEFLKELKSDDRTSNTEVIVVTGMQDSSLKRTALDLGAADLLHKPVDREELLARIRSVLRTKSYRMELEKKNVMLEEQIIISHKMEVVGLLAAGVAHDLNNILTAVIGYSQLVRQQLSADPAGSKMQGMVEKIVSVSTRAGRIVQQILKFSKETAAENELCRLTDIIQECVDMVKISMPKGIDVEFDDLTTRGMVEADSGQIYQVFMNLFINAIHAMDQEGLLKIEVTEAVDTCGTEGSEADGPYIRVEVSDSGTGMDRTTLEHIFDPLFTTKATEGTGLGLSVTQRIIKNHRGWIAVESQPGAGSRFTVWLPMADDTTETALFS